jgi:hypothetical protein
VLQKNCPPNSIDIHRTLLQTSSTSATLSDAYSHILSFTTPLIAHWIVTATRFTMTSTTSLNLKRTLLIIAAMLSIGTALLFATPNQAEARTSVSVNVGGYAGPGYVNVGYRRGYGNGYGPRYYGSRYYGYGPYRSGWYGPRYSLGLWLPILPIGYASYYYGGTRYYGYGDSYFIADGAGYRVVERPVNIVTGPAVVSDPGPAPVVAAPLKVSEGAPTPTFDQQARTGQLFAYPLKGQTDSQATFDRIECESWGSKQTGYSPTSAAQDAGKKADYTRAVSACLEGRGYSVK